MALFIPFNGPLMLSPKGGWTVERAEDLLRSLTGVVSARVVVGESGEVEEIHLLTTDQVGPKQTVRNVESALMAHLDLVVDHRRISVAQTSQPVPRANGDQLRSSAGIESAAAKDGKEGRILFVSHLAEPERTHRVRYQVEVEWQGQRFIGDASGADLPRNRLETVAHATLRGVEAAVAAGRGEERPMVALELDGVRLVEAFDRTYALVAVHAIGGREIRRLSGASIVDGGPDRAVIQATLQAADRWVRGRLRDRKK
jgi:hypothetical protein